jgi:hypothetical protein
VTLLELVVRYDKMKIFYGLWNTTNEKWAQIMLNGFREYRLLSFLICNLTATVQNLHSDWRGGGVVTWRLSQATEECVQFWFRLERLMYTCLHLNIIHWAKCGNIVCYQFNNDKIILSSRITSFINTNDKAAWFGYFIAVLWLQVIKKEYTACIIK